MSCRMLPNQRVDMAVTQQHA